MKVSARGCALALVGVAAPLLMAPPASAATSTLPATSGGYFYAGGVPDTGTEAGKPPNVTAQADGVSPRNLGVATSNGQENKVSFLGFDLSSLPEGTTVDKAVLSVPLTKPDPPRDVFVAASAERVRACAAGDQGFGGEDGESLTVAPDRLCDVFEAPATASSDGSRYEFDITGLAQSLMDGEADGVALTGVAGAPSFQVVFRPFAEARLALGTTAPAPAAAAPNTGADLGAIDTPTGGDLDAGSTEGTGTTDLAGGFSGGTALPEVLDTGTGVAESPSVGALDPVEPEVQLVEPAGSDGEAPQVAGNTLAQAREVPLTPGGAFWFGGLLLAALLLLVGLVLGDPDVGSRATGGQRSRLDRALAEGRKGLGGPVR